MLAITPLSMGFRASSIRAMQSGETWKDVVQEALRKLGGEGHLRDINRLVENHPKTRTNPTWKDTIRRVVRQYAVFAPVGRARSGVYRLVEQPVLPSPHKEKATHATVQGMLLRLGQIYGYDTFAPAPDRQSRSFQGTPLVNLVTVTDCSEFCPRRTSLARIRQIDAIWLQEDNQGAYPAYAFEVEHTTRVRSGMDRLTEIPERYHVPLFVVAPGNEERRLFETLVQQNRYRRFRDRMVFRCYEELEKLFNSAVLHNELGSSFGVAPRRFYP